MSGPDDRPEDEGDRPAIPSRHDLERAAERLAGRIHATPVMRSRSLDAIAGCSLFFKCEHLQRAGAFKFRGASNAVWSLTRAQADRGVVTQSSGNHGAAIALACKDRGIGATVVVPRGAAKVKLAAIADFGARIVPCETSQADRDRVTAQVLADTGACLIHPFDDVRVIAGQATAAMEMFGQVGPLDDLLAPVSGGGLLSGTCLAAGALSPRTRLFGAEPTGAADAHDSLACGRRITGRATDTLCDGLRAELSERTFSILADRLDAVLLCSDDQVVAAMRLIWERLKQVVEPSAAITLAAVLANRERFAGRKVGLILSGGNVDLQTLSWNG